MKLPSTVLLCPLFIVILISCQQEQGNLTSVSQEDVYVFGVWKAPTAKSAKEVMANVSARIHAHSEKKSALLATQSEETQHQIDINQKDSKFKPVTGLEKVYQTLPYSTTAAPETLLPEDEEATDWVRVSKPSTYNSETLYKDLSLIHI